MLAACQELHRGGPVPQRSGHSEPLRLYSCEMEQFGEEKVLGLSLLNMDLRIWLLGLLNYFLS